MIVLLAGLAMSGCVVASRGAVASPHVEVLGNTGYPSQYGNDATQIFDNAALREKIRALFGQDWNSPNPIGLSAPAPAFFAESSPPTMLRIVSSDWIAVRGCMAGACESRHGLVLIGPGGNRLYARLDDRGFTKEYGYGRGMGDIAPEDHALIDAAWDALALGSPRLSRGGA
jgi:hypothetical protein